LVLSEIEAISTKFPEPKNRLIEIEVKDGQARRI
jgi:hypothetical protein